MIFCCLINSWCIEREELSVLEENTKMAEILHVYVLHWKKNKRAHILVRPKKVRGFFITMYFSGYVNAPFDLNMKGKAIIDNTGEKSNQEQNYWKCLHVVFSFHFFSLLSRLDSRPVGKVVFMNAFYLYFLHAFAQTLSRILQNH